MKKFITILSIAVIPQISIDMYAPSLPLISRNFHMSPEQAKLTIFFFILGVMLLVLLYSLVSDYFGKKPVFIFGLLVAMLGTVVCFLSCRTFTLEIGRFIQGAGLGACVSLWRALLKESYSQHKLRRMSTIFSICFISSSMISPLLGGFFQKYFSWRVGFMLLFLWMFILLFSLILFYKEGVVTLPYSSFKKAAHHHIRLFGNRQFVSVAFCSLLIYGSIISWLSSAPYIFIDQFHYSSLDYGFFMLFLGGVIIFSIGINILLSYRINIMFLLKMGVAFMILSGMIMNVTLHWGGSVFFLISAIMYFFSLSLVSPNLFPIAFGEVSSSINFASAIYSFLQIIGGLLFSFWVSKVSLFSVMDISYVFIAVGSLIGTLFLIKPFVQD